MWWRFITFCVLVCFVLFVVLSCIHGRPVIHLLFRRCCEDDIENDQVILENFGNNYLRERLVGDIIKFDDNDSFVSNLEVEDMINAIKSKVNVHDPRSRDVLESSYNKDAETKANATLKAVAHELLDLLGENVTFTDLLDSHKTTDKSMMTSENEVVSKLDSEENDSIEVTTENNCPVKTKVGLPLRMTDIFMKRKPDASKDSVEGETKENGTKNVKVLNEPKLILDPVTVV